MTEPTHETSAPADCAAAVQANLAVLCEDTTFLKWSNNGKEASLVVVSVDEGQRVLRIESTTSEGVAAIDLRQIKVRGARFARYISPSHAICMRKSSVTLYVMQLVLSGNKPKDNSKIKKILNCEEVID